MNYRALGAQSITGLHDPIYATSIRGEKRIGDCCDHRTIAKRVGGGASRDGTRKLKGGGTAKPIRRAFDHAIIHAKRAAIV